MAQGKRWSPLAAALYGLVFGAVAGGLTVWATDRGDWWQHQAGIILAVTMMTVLSCVAAFYARNFFLR
jgi:hypothetical protein